MALYVEPYLVLHGAGYADRLVEEGPLTTLRVSHPDFKPNQAAARHSPRSCCCTGTWSTSTWLRGSRPRCGPVR